MSRPEVVVQNHREVYEWYRHHGQRPKFAAFGHRAVAAVHKPDTSSDPSTAETLSALLETHTRLVLVGNHIDARDVTVLPAIAWRYAPLRPIVGRARIVAKQEMFNGEFLGKSVPPAIKSLGGFAMRRVGDALGMIPALRGSSNQDVDRNMLIEAHQGLAETVGHFLTNGVHIALFGEGTRNRDDPQTVQAIKPGLRHMLEAAPAVDTAVVPIGIWYPEDGHVRTHIGEPISAPLTLADLTGEVRGHLQQCVNLARTTETR